MKEQFEIKTYDNVGFYSGHALNKILRKSGEIRTLLFKAAEHMNSLDRDVAKLTNNLSIDSDKFKRQNQDLWRATELRQKIMEEYLDEQFEMFYDKRLKDLKGKKKNDN